MRILTVRRPWAWAIVHGGKDVENRVRNLAGGYRGLVAIHVGLAAPEPGEARRASILALQKRRASELDFTTGQTAGAILGVVDLVDVHHADWCWDGVQVHCSRWAEGDDVYHLVLENPRPLREPMPLKGALGLRVLDDETAAAVLAAIA